MATSHFALVSWSTRLRGKPHIRGKPGAAAIVAEAAELVAAQAASKGESGGGCQQGSTRERALRCGSALERGDGAAPEPFAQLGDALGGVVAAATGAEAAELVFFQAASKGEGRPQQAANRRATGEQAGVSVLRAWSLQHT